MIQAVENTLEKARIVDDILTDLPEWFGMPGTSPEYIAKAKTCQMWKALFNEEPVGFITVRETSPDTLEIYCMGIKREFHRQGIGKLLVAHVIEYASGNYQLLQVKTVAAGKYPHYDRTVNFYHALGFIDVEVFPKLWNEWNPSQQMILPL